VGPAVGRVSEHDVIRYGPPPATDAGTAAFGAAPVRAGNAKGVRIMLKGFELMSAPDGEAIAYAEVEIAGAVQAVQALRQAIEEARRGRFR
jgi:hypothetical protein